MKAVHVAMLCAVLASGASSAREIATCQPDCALEKRACSALAQHEAKKENGPLATMNEELPHISGSAANRRRSFETRDNLHRDFENRTFQRNRTCDDKYMKCVRVCSGQADGAEEGSVVLRPKSELR